VIYILWCVKLCAVFSWKTVYYYDHSHDCCVCRLRTFSWQYRLQKVLEFLVCWYVGLVY